MRKKKFDAIAIALFVGLGTAHHAVAQDATTPYPNMAAINQYLMADQGAEIARARCAVVYCTRFRGTGSWTSWLRIDMKSE